LGTVARECQAARDAPGAPERERGEREKRRRRREGDTERAERDKEGGERETASLALPTTLPASTDLVFLSL
jgi:hypothetical protein